MTQIGQHRDGYSRSNYSGNDYNKLITVQEVVPNQPIELNPGDNKIQPKSKNHEDCNTTNDDLITPKDQEITNENSTIHSEALRVEDRTEVDDKSKESGWRESLYHFFCHSIETLKSIPEKIWGKPETENVSNGERENNPDRDEVNDHSKSYFEPIFTPIKDAFTWIFSLGEFFSTHSETAAKQNSTDLLNENQGGKPEDDDLSSSKDNDGTPPTDQKPREFNKEQEYTHSYYNGHLTQEEYESSYLNSIPENDGDSSDSEISGEGYYWRRPPTDPFPQYDIYGNKLD